MEGPSPEIDRYADPAMKILVSGLDDWVSLARAQSLVQVALNDTGKDRRSETLAVIEKVLVEGLAVAGDLSRDGFEPWTGSAQDIVERTADGWREPDADDWLYSAWLANTELVTRWPAPYSC